MHVRIHESATLRRMRPANASHGGSLSHTDRCRSRWPRILSVANSHTSPGATTCTSVFQPIFGKRSFSSMFFHHASRSRVSDSAGLQTASQYFTHESGSRCRVPHCF